MSFKRIILALLLLSASLHFTTANSQTYVQLSNVQWPNLTYTSCTPSPVYVNLWLNCTNLNHVGNTFTVNGFNITVNVNYAVTSCMVGFQQHPGFQINLGLLPAGTYAVTVNGTVNSAIHSTLSSSLTVSNIGCCPIYADAGNDTTVCEQTSIQLDGNVPLPISTGNWTVLTGTGTIASSTAFNATATNLSYGLNEFIWTITDTVCVTDDTVKIVNLQNPSNAITEIDKFSCFDSTIVHATPATIGSGQWNAITAGVFVLGKSNPVANAFNLIKGSNLIEWETKNGICPAKKDTLEIDYQQVTDTPTVTINGLILTSSSAPSYQWYLNQSAINGANGQSYTATSNGLYKVFTVQPNCTNGLFSNDIVISGVGIDELTLNELRIFPNPSEGLVTLTNLEVNSTIRIYDINGKQVYSHSNVMPTLMIDLSELPEGMYSISVQNENTVSTGKIVLNH